MAWLGSLAAAPSLALGGGGVMSVGALIGLVIVVVLIALAVEYCELGDGPQPF